MILLLSGVSGSGKSTACSIAARYAVDSGRRVGGVICAALFEHGQKSGISCAALREGRTVQLGILARARPDWIVPRMPPEAGSARPLFSVPFDDTDPHIIRYGMWAFERTILSKADETAAAYLLDLRASAGLPPLIIIDEIGPLELDRSIGMVKTLRLLDHLAAGAGKEACHVVVARPDIAARLQKRWPAAVVLVIEAGQADQTAREIILRSIW
ncbi:MAG TPA: nucleoside-triphosphatase [bacterium]|nr:nucleoside-triphosphatase [bacterium]